MPNNNFEEALKKLIVDADFRKAVMASPDKLKSDFHLSPMEIEVLRRTGVSGGWVPNTVAAAYCCCSCCCTS